MDVAHLEKVWLCVEGARRNLLWMAQWVVRWIGQFWVRSAADDRDHDGLADAQQFVPATSARHHNQNLAVRPDMKSRVRRSISFWRGSLNPGRRHWATLCPTSVSRPILDRPFGTTRRDELKHGDPSEFQMRWYLTMYRSSQGI